MRVPHLMRRLLARLPLVLMALAAGVACAGELQVAVAANFAEPLRALADTFTKQTGHTVTLVVGSTAKQYAQIIAGAPFDAFFAADSARPQLLEESQLTQPGSRFTYAQGRLVLWSPQPGLVDAEGTVLHGAAFKHLALANPRLAPYGKAAQETLQKLGRWTPLRDQLVIGEDVGQAYHFVASGNAELGFVALSQVQRPGQALAGSLWRVPAADYTPLNQQAVQLTTNPIARDFLAFVRTPAALELIRSYGYGTP